MALPTNYSRPVSLPYDPPEILPEFDRYRGMGDKPPTPEQLDADFNALVAYINILAAAINETAAGIVPGADSIQNAHKLVTTDGMGNVDWVLAQGRNIDDSVIDTRHLRIACVSSENIIPQAITESLLYPRSVTALKIGLDALQKQHFSDDCIPEKAYEDNTIFGSKLVNGTIDTGKYADSSITADKIAEAAILLSKLSPEVKYVLMPTGTILEYGGETIPDELKNYYLLADGSAVSRATYAALFSVCGTQYGAGDGSTTFNLPDKRGRVSVGCIGGSTGGRVSTATASSLAIGGHGGEERHTLTLNESPPHEHNIINVTGVVASLGGPGGPLVVSKENQEGFKYRTDSKGGGQPHNNMPPFLLTNFIIRI